MKFNWIWNVFFFGVGLFFCLNGTGFAQPKIVFLGDSLTDGYGVPREKAFPELVKQKLSAQGFPTVEVINAGEASITSATAPERVSWLIKSNPDFIVISLGANDGLRGMPPAETQKNLAQAIEIAQKAKVKVALTGMKLPYNYGPQHRKKFEAIYPALAKKYKVELFPFLLEDVAGKKELNLTDGHHPNEKGYEIIAQNIFPWVLKQLK